MGDPTLLARVTAEDETPWHVIEGALQVHHPWYNMVERCQERWRLAQS